MNSLHNTIPTPTTHLPLTVNIHVTRSCNFRCACCYAGFKDAGYQELAMDYSKWGRVIDELACLPKHPSGRSRKITFSGGEPTLLPFLPDLMRQCRQAGFTTSLITNGSLLAPACRMGLLRNLDWLGISVDSTDPNTLRRLGRCCSDGCVVTVDDLASAIVQARQAGCRIKLNTVVSQLNMHERLGAAVAVLRPDRWKVLQMMTVAGQNDRAGECYGVTASEFAAFVAVNTSAPAAAGVTIVPEDADAIAGSYCMIGPNGCFFDDITGRHRYSRSILSVGAQSAFGDMYFNPNAFDARGGSYV
jgi:radical S-adenosyl methionine domain-containing protein 2